MVFLPEAGTVALLALFSRVTRLHGQAVESQQLDAECL